MDVLPYVSLNSLDNLERIAALWSIPHLSGRPLWRHTAWDRELALAILPYEHLHPVFFDTNLMREELSDLLMPASKGVIWKGWLEDMVNFTVNSKCCEVAIDNMKLHRHEQLWDVCREDCWRTIPQVWSLVPLQESSLEFDQFLSEGGHTDRLLIALRVWQRKQLGLIAGPYALPFGETISLAYFQFGLATLDDVLRTVEGLVGHLGEREQCAWMLETLIALLPQLDNTDKVHVLQRILDRFEVRHFPPSIFRDLLESDHFLSLHFDQVGRQHKWEQIFLHMLRYYPDELSDPLPHSPYAVRFIRWQSLYVIPKRRMRARCKTINFETITASLSMTSLLGNVLDSDEVLTVEHEGDTTIIRTLLELCEWYLQQARTSHALKIDPFRMAIIDPQMKYTKSIFRAALYKFTLIGIWDEILDPKVVELFWFPSTKQEQCVTTLMKEYSVHMKSKRSARMSLQAWTNVRITTFKKYFQPTDPVFRI